MTAKNLIFNLKEISHFYGEKKVLEINDLEIEKGSITGLIGPNGSGKSTLLKLLAFAQKPTVGDIFYKGEKGFPFSPMVRSKVTLLTQKPYLLKRTVFENIAYGLKIRKETDKLEDKVRGSLLNVGLDYDVFARRKWHQLSGGEAQRVAMAARLILKPEVLLLDEPTASVDTESAKLIRQASLAAREKWGTTLIVASHDLQWLYSISDSQLSLFEGNIFFAGMENIITGPFEKNEQNNFQKKVIKKLSDNQTIILNAPKNNESTAIVRKDNISISLKRVSNNGTLNQLSGHIISMLLKKKNGGILANIIVNGITFVIVLSPDQIRSRDLYPGKEVILNFNCDDVEWI
jgi:tungstate transport system ATP-binding protein